MWPFKKRALEAHATTVPELMEMFAQQMSGLEKRLDTLTDEHERLKAQHLSLRGRVYALWGTAKGAPDADTSAESPTSSPPKVETKAQVKMRLLREGILVPGKPTQHT